MRVVRYHAARLFARDWLENDEEMGRYSSQY
jgi:hypothetical protein